MLDIKNLYVNYGHIKVLHDLNINIKTNETVALIGSNGAGKTTLMNTISGIKEISEGNITYKDTDITNFTPKQRVEYAMAHVPEGRAIFKGQSVAVNLELGAYRLSDSNQIKRNFDFAYSTFPILYEKRNLLSGNLSGGQQQMLAIARALMSNPDLLLLDEPSMGLAPIIIEEIFKFIEKLKKTQLTIFLVEQNSNFALSVSDKAYIIENGKIVLSGESSELLKNPKVKEAYLGI